MEIVNKVIYLKKNQVFFLIIIINLIIRLLFFINVNENILQFSDQTKYITISDSLLKNFNFSTSTILGRTPGYPLFLFLIRSVFDNLIFVIFVQNCLGILSILLIYNTAKQFSKELSLLTTFIFSINLNIILYQNLIMTESIFIITFISFIYFFLRFIRYKKIKYLIYFSLAISLSALIRPQVYYIILFIFLMMFLLVHAPLKQKIKFFLIFILIFKSCLFTWEFRNFKVYENYFFVIAKEVNLIGYYLPAFNQYEYKISLNEAKKKSHEKWRRYLNNQKNTKLELEKDNQISQLIYKEEMVQQYALKELLNYKISTLIKGTFFGSFKTIFTPALLDIGYFFKLKNNSFSSTEGASFIEQAKNFIKKTYQTNSKYFLFFILSLLVMFFTKIIQLYGFLLLLKTNMKLSLIFIFLISFFLVLLGPIGAPKYRIPFELFFSYYLAVGLYGINKIFKNKNKKNIPNNAI